MQAKQLPFDEMGGGLIGLLAERWGAREAPISAATSAIERGAKGSSLRDQAAAVETPASYRSLQTAAERRGMLRVALWLRGAFLAAMLAAFGIADLFAADGHGVLSLLLAAISAPLAAFAWRRARAAMERLNAASEAANAPLELRHGTA